MFICSVSSPRLCMHSPEEPLETIRGTSTVPPCGYSVTMRGNHPHLFGKQRRGKKNQNNRKNKQKTYMLERMRLGLISQQSLKRNNSIIN